MDADVKAALDGILTHITELQQVVAAHRALISQHQSALKTVATVMEQNRDVDLALPGADRPA